MKAGAKLSRRFFFKGIAAAGALAGLPSAQARATGRERLAEFDYSAVTITGGPLKRQFDRIHAAYLGLDNNRLLKVYRQRAGLSAPGDDMGGWYDANGFCPGHSLGQYISGLSRFARATGNVATYAKVKELVDGFAATVGSDNYPYASPKASATWPCYILDKFEIGLLDAYRLGGLSSARQLLTRVIHGALPYLPARVHDRVGVKHPPYDEPYILPENLFEAFAVTGRNEFLTLARKYLLNKEYFEPLARGEDVLPGKQAYSHVMALSSAAKAYLVDGDPEYLDTLQNAWEMLERKQKYRSGGWGPNEMFVEPGRGELGKSLVSTHAHFETPCGCYAQFKLARYLLQATGDARYGDGLERVLYNAILGAKDPSGDGHFFYYSDYHPLARKTYYPQKWPCCSGTLVQDVADYLIGIYFQGPNGIHVNLFVPSRLRCHVNRVPITITQTTGYPATGEIELRFDSAAPVTFTLHVRIPGWLQAPGSFRLNGKPLEVPAKRGAFAAIRRHWRKNDTVEIAFPLGLRVEPVDEQHPARVAVMRGPVMLVALDPPAGLSEEAMALPQALQPVPFQALAFEAGMGERKLRFAPFYSVGDQPYTNYLLNRSSHQTDALGPV